MTQGCSCAREPPRCSWGGPGSAAPAHCTHSETGKGVNKNNSLFQSLTVLEHLNREPWFPAFPVILHIIAKKSLEVLRERKSCWAMASACMARARGTWAPFRHQLQFNRLEKSWLLESFYSGCPSKCFYRVALSFSRFKLQLKGW